MKPFLVVSGLPASGKSTLARTLAKSLSLPLLDKDEILEELFETEGAGDEGKLRELSVSADQEFQRRAVRSNGAVLTSWWKHPLSAVKSGTSTSWLSRLPGPVVELHCVCSPPIAVKRFFARQRHPGHLDGRWVYTQLLESFEQQALLGALSVFPVIEVSSETEIGVSVLLSRLEKVFSNTPRAGSEA